MSKKPSFANLGSRLARKPSDGPNASPARRTRTAAPAASETGSSEATGRGRHPDGRRGILVRARPEAWKALKQVALDGDRTLQDVMTEAINDVLTKHGKSPLA